MHGRAVIKKMSQESAIDCPAVVISEFEANPRFAEFGGIEPTF
jgi:hypothetical protein